jgi:hypothetical protein
MPFNPDHEETEAFLNELDDDCRREEAELRANALPTLVRAVEKMNKALVEDMEGDCEPAKLPLPTEVIEVLDVQVSAGYRKSSTLVRARARRSDGEIDVIECSRWSDTGDRETPPEGEENVFWEGLDDAGYAVVWEHLYTIKRPEQPMTIEITHRKNKVEYLHVVLRHAGVRARVHEGRLEYDQNKKLAVYEALARHLINLSPGNLLFHGVIRCA